MTKTNPFKWRHFESEIILLCVRWYLRYSLSYRITIRQCKYLNNIVEQDHRPVKRISRPMVGFKNFHAAQKTLTGIEVMAMIKKGQMKTTKGDDRSPAELFYALAA
jgi:transposase-like protein